MRTMMGVPDGDHLAEVFAMYGAQGNEQGQERTRKQLAALGLDTSGKPVTERQAAAGQRQAAAEAKTPPAGKTARDTPPAGRQTAPRART